MNTIKINERMGRSRRMYKPPAEVFIVHMVRGSWPFLALVKLDSFGFGLQEFASKTRNTQNIRKGWVRQRQTLILNRNFSTFRVPSPSDSINETVGPQSLSQAIVLFKACRTIIINFFKSILILNLLVIVSVVIHHCINKFK